MLLYCGALRWVALGCVALRCVVGTPEHIPILHEMYIALLKLAKKALILEILIIIILII